MEHMEGMWRFIWVGAFGAVGAALAVGTLAALFRWYRTGTWPDGTGDSVGTGRLVGLWMRVLVGAVVATWAVVSLSGDGLLGF